MSTFTQDLRSAIFSLINEIRIFNGIIMIPNWDRPSAKRLRYLIDSDVITKEETLEKINLSLKNMGRVMYNQHINTVELPDHTLMPDTFAYALAHGEFTNEERDKINSGDNNSEKSFIAGYTIAKDLPLKILGELLSGK